MHFLAVVLKIKSNLIQILTRITVEIRTGKERSYGSVFHIVAMFPPILDIFSNSRCNFPKLHKLYKIFNRNNAKISYSSMPNFASIINLYYTKIINKDIPKPSAPTCNCHSETSGPLNGDCLQSSLVYICKSDMPNIIQNHPHYTGLTQNRFDDRFYKHKNSFKCESKCNATELSNFVWESKHAESETNLVRDIR